MKQVFQIAFQFIAGLGFIYWYFKVIIGIYKGSPKVLNFFKKKRVYNVYGKITTSLTLSLIVSIGLASFLQAMISSNILELSLCYKSDFSIKLAILIFIISFILNYTYLYLYNYLQIFNNLLPTKNTYRFASLQIQDVFILLGLFWLCCCTDVIINLTSFITSILEYRILFGMSLVVLCFYFFGLLFLGLYQIEISEEGKCIRLIYFTKQRIYSLNRISRYKIIEDRFCGYRYYRAYIVLNGGENICIGKYGNLNRDVLDFIFDILKKYEITEVDNKETI